MYAFCLSSPVASLVLKHGSECYVNGYPQRANCAGNLGKIIPKNVPIVHFNCQPLVSPHD